MITSETALIEKYLQEGHLLKLYPGPDIIEIMLDLLRRCEIKKQGVFDLQLVATMLSNNIKRICTFNRGHFEKFTDIEALEPSTVYKLLGGIEPFRVTNSPN